MKKKRRGHYHSLDVAMLSLSSSAIAIGPIAPPCAIAIDLSSFSIIVVVPHVPLGGGEVFGMWFAVVVLSEWGVGEVWLVLCPGAARPGQRG